MMFHTCMQPYRVFCMAAWLTPASDGKERLGCTCSLAAGLWVCWPVHCPSARIGCPQPPCTSGTSQGSSTCQGHPAGQAGWSSGNLLWPRSKSSAHGKISGIFPQAMQEGLHVLASFFTIAASYIYSGPTHCVFWRFALNSSVLIRWAAS
jgi:hypothetical protein